MSKIIPNSFQTPNYYADEVMRYLDGAELKILLYAIRRTFGFQQNSARISLNQFCDGTWVNGEQKDNGTGLARGTAIKVINDLLEAKILLLVTKGHGRECNEYAINLDSSTINLAKFIEREQTRTGNIASKIEKANAGRKAKQQAERSQQDGVAVHPMNHISGSSDERYAVHPMNDMRFNGRTSSGSTDEPHDLLHGKPEENQKENQGKASAPFDPFEEVPDTDRERAIEDARQAIIKLFKGALSQHSERVGQLALMVADLKAPVAYVAAWPNWFRTRYKGRPASHLQFGDTFAELAEQGLEPDAWLNGSGGARFIAGVCGYLTKPTDPPKPVSAAVAHEIVTYGHWLDAQTGLQSRDEWLAAKITPIVFNKFWKERFPGAGKPRPETVIRYWRDFYESLPGKERE